MDKRGPKLRLFNPHTSNKLPAMRRLALSWVPLALVISLLLAPFAFAATTSTPAKPAATSDRSPSAPIATAISTVTGIAISPLLGTAGYGAYKWMAAKGPAARAALPWFADIKFWLPALLIVAVCAAKDAFGAIVPPGWKKPLDVLETLENKISGLVAAGAVVPLTMSALSKMAVGSHAADHASWSATGLAMLPLGAADFSWLLNILTVPFGVAIFAIVWMASHAINVLILLSPWGAIDAALKSARTALLGVVTITATFNPWLSAGLSIVVIIVAYFVAGWAFRLTVFGTVFSWDFFTVRRSRFRVKENENLVFAGGNLKGVPVRSYGRLTLCEGEYYQFTYRPWLVMRPQTASVAATPQTVAVGQGLFFSSITSGEDETLFLLPPRYRGHEDQVASVYHMQRGVKPAGLRKAWSVFRELFGGAAAKTQVV